MKIEVTADDIKKSREMIQSTSVPIAVCCPIALAAERTYGRPARVSKAGITLPDDATWYPLPDEARYFVHDYDEGCDVKPFTFDLPD